MPNKPKTKTEQAGTSTDSLQPLLETMVSLLGRLVFPEEKLKGIVMWKKRNPEDYVKAYNLCDGNHTLSQIAEVINVNVSTLSRIFPDWQELGIVYEITRKGGKFYKRLYRLGMPKEKEMTKEEKIATASEQIAAVNPQTSEPAKSEETRNQSSSN